MRLKVVMPLIAGCLWDPPPWGRTPWLDCAGIRSFGHTVAVLCEPFCLLALHLNIFNTGKNALFAVERKSWQITVSGLELRDRHSLYSRVSLLMLFLQQPFLRDVLLLCHNVRVNRRKSVFT